MENGLKTMTPVETLAQRFAEILRGWLTKQKWEEMVRRNVHEAVYEDNVSCASQDFCDANVAMARAWEETIGGEPDCGSDQDAATWNLAWEIARREYLGDASWRNRAANALRFRDLAVGQTFDFVQDGSFTNCFFEPCKKISVRGYVAVREDGAVNERYGRMRVGTINVKVYHVGGAK